MAMPVLLPPRRVQVVATSQTDVFLDLWPFMWTIGILGFQGLIVCTSRSSNLRGRIGIQTADVDMDAANNALNPATGSSPALQGTGYVTSVAKQFFRFDPTDASNGNILTKMYCRLDVGKTSMILVFGLTSCFRDPSVSLPPQRECLETVSIRTGDVPLPPGCISSTFHPPQSMEEVLGLSASRLELTATWVDRPDPVGATLVLDDVEAIAEMSTHCGAGAPDPDDTDPVDYSDSCITSYSLTFGLHTADGRMDTLRRTEPDMYWPLNGLVVTLAATDFADPEDPVARHVDGRDLQFALWNPNPTACVAGELILALDPTAPYGDPDSSPEAWINQPCLGD
jgi:hypothetical protein